MGRIISEVMSKREFFSLLPQVDEILNEEEIKGLLTKYPRTIVLESIRESIDFYRNIIVKTDEDDLKDFVLNNELIIHRTEKNCIKKYSLSLKRVINATGTVLHTNLGRSLLSDKIKEEIWEAASRYSNLEYNIDKGSRGSRYVHLTDMIKRLTGAEDVLVVNNNAAAVLLTLSTMAKDGEAIVSRGELVEVGGSFRIPSIMALSGANLIEVGATNKTHLSDYEDSITDSTKVLMKVHTSNYKIMGFVESVSNEDLVSLGKKYDLPVIEDLGSGVFIDLSKYNLSYEPTVMDSINQGVDVVTFSGDKMLGGPQAGIIVGKKKYIEKMKKNQLTRALRVDKLTISALEATLRLYLNEEDALKQIPTLRMLTYTIDEIEKKAIDLRDMINKNSIDAIVDIEDGISQVGGGSMPIEKLPTKVVTIRPNNISITSLEQEMRLGQYHVIARVYDDKYVLDPRTIFKEEFEYISDELLRIINGN